MRRLVMLLVAVAVATTAVFTAPASFGASPPTVTSTIEGLDSLTGQPVIALIGKKVSKFKTFEIRNPDGSPAGSAERTHKSGSLIVVRFDLDLPPGPYDLVLGFGKTGTQTHRIEIGNGQPLPGSVMDTALDPVLVNDLGDADMLGGEDKAYYRNASNLNAGTLDTARFSAYDDLRDSGEIGTAAGQVAAGDHDHDGTYATDTHAHDGRYFTESELQGVGKINTRGNPVHWTNLDGVPAGLADGVDNDTNTTYGAGTGLIQTGTTFSVDFGTTATEAATGNHAHDSAYVNASGDTMTGQLMISTAGSTGLTSSVAGTSDDALFGEALASTGTTTGVYGFASSTLGRGVFGTATATSGATYGGRFESASSSGFGVMGFASRTSGSNTGGLFETASSSGTAVHCKATSTASTTHYGIRVDHEGGGRGIKVDMNATTGFGYGIEVNANSTNGLGVWAKALATTGSTWGVYAQNKSSSGRAVFALADSTTGSTYGVDAQASSTAATGVKGNATATTGATYGVDGLVASTSGTGVRGRATANSGTIYGVRGASDSNAANSAGVLAESTRNGGTALIANAANTGTSGNIVSFRDNGTERARLTRAGTFSAVAYGTISDARLKKDVAPVTGVLPKLRDIGSYRYRMKDPSLAERGDQLGMMAQEVRQHFPELVEEHSDGYLTLNYSSFTSVLLQGLKEQQHQIERRDARVADLEERLARLEKLLAGREENPAAPAAK